MSHVYVGKVRKRISAEHQVSAELVTVTTTARSPQGKPRQRVAEILGVPSENLKATETTGGLSAERITQELVRRVAKGEDYKAVKEELARKVDSGAAARAAEQKARAGARGEKTRFYARRWREQQVAGALERVAQSTRRLDTRPEGVLGRDLLAVWREADRQQRDPEAMQRPYPGTFEERQALRSDPHHHKN